MARRSDGSVFAWGWSSPGPSHAPHLPAGLSWVQIACAHRLTVARRSDGAVFAWGTNAAGECNVPPLPPGLTYVEVAAGGTSLPSGLGWTAPVVLGRRSDGSVVGWGYNGAGQLLVPQLTPGVTYTQVSVGRLHCLALRSDGTVAAWGSNLQGQCVVPPLPPGLTYVEVAAGAYCSVARRSDGSVVQWGSNSAPVLPLPPGVIYLQIAAGNEHSVARRSDGEVVVWGFNWNGQFNVPALPNGVVYVDIAASGSYSVARRSDGQAVGWGINDFGQSDVAPLLAGFAYTAIAAGQTHAAGIYEPMHPVLQISQPFGPTTGVFVSDSLLTQGSEHYNVFSFDVCAGGPGTGPFGGLCFTNVGDLLSQLQLPLGTHPFHFIAPATAATFGPYALVTGFTFDALCCDVTGGIILSPVVRYTVQ